MKKFSSLSLLFFLLAISWFLPTQINAIGEYCCDSGYAFNQAQNLCLPSYVPPGTSSPPGQPIKCLAPDSCLQTPGGRGVCVACDPSNPSRCSSNNFCCNERDAFSTNDKLCHTIGGPGRPSQSYEPLCPADEVCIRVNGEGLLAEQRLRGVCSLPPNTITCDPNDPLSCPNGQYCTANRHCEFNNVFSFDLCSTLMNNVEKYRECDNCIRGNNGVWTALGCISYNPSNFVADFLKIAIGIAGGIALLLMIYGSFLISTSAGDPKKSEEGKEIITGTIAGLLFIIFSVFLLRLIGVEILNIPGF